MSTLQLKKTLTSAEPRPVAERTLTVPGMSFMASSIGRVTVAIIWSAGMTPLSTSTTTRGKLVWGKTEDGMVQADRIPARQRQAVRKMTALDCRTVSRLSHELDGGRESIIPAFGLVSPGCGKQQRITWAAARSRAYLPADHSRFRPPPPRPRAGL